MQPVVEEVQHGRAVLVKVAGVLDHQERPLAGVQQRCRQDLPEIAGIALDEGDPGVGELGDELDVHGNHPRVGDALDPHHVRKPQGAAAVLGADLDDRPGLQPRQQLKVERNVERALQERDAAIDGPEDARLDGVQQILWQVLVEGPHH